MYAEFSVFLGGKVGRFWKHAPNLFSPKKDQHVFSFYFVNNFKIIKASDIDFFLDQLPNSQKWFYSECTASSEENLLVTTWDWKFTVTYRRLD